MHEETVAQETLFEGQLLRLELLQVRLPNGHLARREIIRHCGAVCAAVFDVEGRAVLVRQYRKGPERVLLEIPAGKLDPGESPDQAILRELREEVGFVSGQVVKVFEFYTAPGFCDELITAYLVTEAVLREPAPDEDEFIELVTMTRQELLEAVLSGQIVDAKTLATCLEALRRLGI